jgi:bisphosphoglycerate-independent phosphoglycerate mutase (AlkP superfamily)
MPEDRKDEFDNLSIEDQVGNSLVIAMMHSELRSLPQDTQMDIITAGLEAYRAAGWITFISNIADPDDSVTIRNMQQASGEAVKAFQPALERFTLLCKLLDEKAIR